MLSNPLFKIFATVAVIIFAIGALIIVINIPKNVKTRSSTIISTLNQFCACYLLTDSRIIDASTGESRQRIPETSPQFPNFLQYLSSSKTQEVIITVDRKEAYLLKYPQLIMTRIYIAPDSRRIGQAVWSVDERTAFFEIVDPNTTIVDGSESVVASVVAVTPVTKEARTMIDVAAIIPDAKNIFTLVWVSDDLKRAVFVMDDISNATWSRWDEGKRTEIKENISSAVYMKIAMTKDQGGKNQANLLWFDGQGLHGYDLNTGKTTTYVISTWSDSPISPPSPDGTSVVYLRRVNDDEAGQFVRLDLRDKSEQLLANDVWIDSPDLGQAVWSPDGTRLLVASTYPEPRTVVVNTQALSPIVSVIHPEVDQLDNRIKAAVPKPTLVL